MTMQKSARPRKQRRTVGSTSCKSMRTKTGARKVTAVECLFAVEGYRKGFRCW
jgi:hypothetical protein